MTHWHAPAAGLVVVLLTILEARSEFVRTLCSGGHDTGPRDSMDVVAGEELSLLQLPIEEGYLALVGTPGHQRLSESVERDRLTEQRAAGTTRLTTDSASPAICLSVVVIVFFVAHLLALVSEMSVTLLGFSPGPVHDSIEQAAVPARGLPMVGLVIVVAQLTVDDLHTSIDPGRYGPTWRVDLAEIVVVVATAVAFACQLLTIALAPPAGSENPSRLRQSCSKVSAGMRTLAVLVQLFFLAVVIVGTTRMDLAFNMWSEMNLAIQHFITFLALLMAAGFDELGQRGPSRATKAFRMGVLSQSLGPMLGICIVVAHWRALELTWSTYHVQDWAEVSFSLAVYGVLRRTIFAVLAAYSEDISKAATEGVWRNCGLLFAQFIAWVSRLSVLTGAGGIVTSTLLLEGSQGKDRTPKLTTPFVCILVLAVQCFASHTLSFLGDLILPKTIDDSEVVFDSLKRTRDTDILCGILCVLFFAARIRAQAHHVSHLALPPNWVQNAMCVCVWASLLHWPLSAASGSAKADTKEDPKKVKVVVLYGQVLCLGFMYAGVIAVLVGVAVMDRDTVLAGPS